MNAVTVATAYAVEAEYMDGPRAELAGSDDMYIPTTQIRIAPDGCWHRRSSIPSETACGASYAVAAVREYELTGELCVHCFTRRERQLARRHAQLRKETRAMRLTKLFALAFAFVISLSILCRVGFEYGYAFADSGAAAAAGSDASAAAGSAAAPATSTMHDPIANPLDTLSDLEAFYKLGGWALVVLGGLYVVAVIAMRSKLSWLAFLQKGRVAIIVAGAAAVLAASVNAFAAGGRWTAVIAAAAGALLLYIQHPASPASSSSAPPADLPTARIVS